MVSPRGRAIALLAWTVGTAALPACGRERPWFAPVPPLQLGQLIVRSEPTGAAIWLDGADTGSVTPDTLQNVASGAHVVRVRLDGWTVQPESLQVSVPVAAAAEAEFPLSELVTPPPKVVLLEGFSNVSCLGCPEMSATLAAVMATPGYGLDRVLLVKYAVNWPQPTDPHYQANPGDNAARLTFYQSQITGVPVLFADGGRAHEPTALPPDADGVRQLVDQLAAGDPGFAVHVDASLQPTLVAATVTLSAVRSVDDPDARLMVMLVENPVQYPTPPGNQHETEFHWIMRDVAAVTTTPLPLSAGTPAVFEADLTRNDAWVAAQLNVIAFVQNTRTRAVLQAGHAPVAGPSADVQSRAPRWSAVGRSKPGSRP